MTFYCTECGGETRGWDTDWAGRCSVCEDSVRFAEQRKKDSEEIIREWRESLDQKEEAK